jgi:hypothetical protein
MTVPNRWYPYTREQIEKMPEGLTGLYVIADEDKVNVYTGSSTSRNVGIRARLISHLIHKRCRKGKYFKYMPEGVLDDARAMESSTVKKHQKHSGKTPKYVKRTPRATDSPFKGWL